MNLAYKFPILFWNTANLIVDSAGIQYDDESSEEIEIELEDPETPDEEIVDIYEPEEWEEYEYEDIPEQKVKKKKKNKSINFGKIAIAIGRFQNAGITILPPDINKSNFTFTPIVEKNAIASGLRNITRISTDIIQKIIENRPYLDIEDFLSKIKVNRLQMLNLIKSGCFDELYPDRMELLEGYISTLAGTKNKLTLANVPMLMKYNLLKDDSIKEYCELYMFNKFIRKNIIDETYIELTSKAAEYYCENFDMDLLISPTTLDLKGWEKFYKTEIKPLSNYIKDNSEILLKELNSILIKEQMNIYANGNISHFEIESMSFYYHEHELAAVNKSLYGIVDFNKLSTEPEIDKVFYDKNGKAIRIYKLNCICGTVLHKDKNKNTISLLTPTGVVTVKIWKNQFVKYDKQISEIQPDGKKKVIEKSWFNRGTLLYLQGIRRDDAFIPKAYKHSPHHIPIMKIINVNNDRIDFIDYRCDEECE